MNKKFNLINNYLKIYLERLHQFDKNIFKIIDFFLIKKYYFLKKGI